MRHSAPLLPTLMAVAALPLALPGHAETAKNSTHGIDLAPPSCCIGGAHGGAGRAGVIRLAAAEQAGEPGPTETATPTAGDNLTTTTDAAPPPPPGMVWVPAGTFTMGSEAPDTWANEHPAHRVRLDGFWIDATEVTNAQFDAFVQATGYVTVAERPVDWEALKHQVPPGTPKPPDEMLQPGSLVFVAPDRPVPLNNVGAWWHWTHHADWRHPAGPDSSIQGIEDHPVVHVAWEDARAYAQWAGKQLPTEAQWEYAARGGDTHTRFAWGDTFRPDGASLVNTWDGQFPHRNTAEDGYVLTAPTKSYPPNALGLYDTAGNVWEWTADNYRDDRHASLARQDPAVNPPGPEVASDMANPGAASKVVKGGSFLCHADYCESYRPAARRGLTPDTSLQHTGFRCVINPAR